MKDDAELLADYVAHRSEAAFTELVRRHLGLVHAVALRRLGGDAQLAEDVAQRVFTDLARKAGSLRTGGSVSGWLYASTLVASAAAVRAEQRRKTRETNAHAMQSLHAENPAEWEKLRPLLDTTIVALREEDRDAIVLRFLQQRSFADVGAALRVSEEAARKRVDRALEKLRGLLARQGVTSPSSALALALGATAATAIAPALTSRIAGTALVEAALPTATTVTAVGVAKAILPAAAMLSIGAFLAHDQHRTNRALAAELASAQSIAGQLDHARTEQRELVDAMRAAEDLRRAAAERAVRVTPRPPVQETSAPDIKADRTGVVKVTPDGRMTWGDSPMALREFLDLLKNLRRPGETGTCALILEAPGAKFPALAYAIDEARKAGIDHVIVRSDAQADPKLGFCWF
ncbi:MAG TPA: sigma-70 family RNA polymerase sigma factor [Opitutaceae bacterium]|nr:sigma-70 family RNA polymerase sigma factor [Opitutaceae bacterium]